MHILSKIEAELNRPVVRLAEKIAEMRSSGKRVPSEFLRAQDVFIENREFVMDTLRSHRGMTKDYWAAVDLIANSPDLFGKRHQELIFRVKHWNPDTMELSEAYGVYDPTGPIQLLSNRMTVNMEVVPAT